MRNWIVLSICLTLMVTAQILWKLGLARLGSVDVTSDQLPAKLLQMIQSWQILAGLALFGICTLLWFDLLSRMELSFLYPFMSFSYVLAFVAGWLWLGEKADPLRMVGILVICGGI